jgi:glycosyltransferase involved in cell wall biosynthesis
LPKNNTIQADDANSLTQVLRSLPGRQLAGKGDSRPAIQQSLVVDGRMLFSSGIGRYLREILSRRPDWQSSTLHVVTNSREQSDWIRTFLPSASLIPSKAGIYSLREQWHALRFPGDSTYWVPHYNVPALSRGRMIVTVHDLAPLALPEAFKGPMKRIAARFYFGRVGSRASRIIAVSNFTRDEMLLHGIADSQRISVIPNGVDSYWFSGEPHGNRRTRLLYVGNLKPHKNLERLVSAIEEVRRHEPVELTIAGKVDGFRSGLESSLIHRLRSTTWIRLLGETSDSHLRKQYSESSALVFPSLYEGFGLPVLEAMAGGCPVVCSNIPALVEVGGSARKDGGIVDYFNPMDVGAMTEAITRSIRMPASERAEISHRGKIHAAGFSWDHTAKATWDLLSGNMTSRSHG